MSIPQIGSSKPPRKPSLFGKIAGAIIGTLILAIAILALLALAGWLLSVVIGVWS